MLIIHESNSCGVHCCINSCDALFYVMSIANHSEIASCSGFSGCWPVCVQSCRIK
jgi:hypothetical protein